MAPRPNVLLLMADQLAAPVLPCYGHQVVQAPNLDALGAAGVVFESAYCNFPICAPSRFSMLSGRLPHAIDAFDNASEFPASIPTMAHYLAAAGYATALAGKMHFIGPDQLHGFEERLTTDIYPAEFLWVPDWTRGAAYRPTGISMRHVVEAGPCVRNMQIDFDEETASAGVQKLFDLARAPQRQPFFLAVSFTHTHPPFVAPQEQWDRYAGIEIDEPLVAPIPYQKLDAHSQWLHEAHGQSEHSITSAQVREARRAYYAMVSYVDEKIGEVLSALRRARLDENTVVVFCGDHGEMLGERGMWFKQTFYEWSVRVPLIVSWPARFAPGREARNVSLVDLLPTLLELAGTAAVEPLDGRSLVPLLAGREESDHDEVLSEYSAEGVCAPSRMLRRGRYKYVFTLGVPPLLFDLEQDPKELSNLAGLPAHRELERSLHERLTADWDAEQVNRRVLESQRRRLFLREAAVKNGRFPSWTYEVRRGDAQRYVRPTPAGAPLGAKPRARFPYVEPVAPERKS